MFTKERIAELRALCDGATEGPWEGFACREIREDAPHLGLCNVRTPDIAGGQQLLIWPWDHGTRPGLCSHPLSPTDAQFIAAARSALPELLDEVEKLRFYHSNENKDRRAAEAENARLRAALVYALKNRGSQFDYDHWIELCTRAGLPMRNGMLDRDALSGDE